MRIQPRRRAKAAGQQHVITLNQRFHFSQVAPVLAQRLHIIRGLEQAGRQDAAEKVAAEIAGPRGQLVLVNREYLALRNDDLDIEPVHHRLRAAVFDFCTEADERADCFLQRCCMFRVRRQILFPVMAQYADLQTADVGIECCTKVRDVMLDAARVLRIVAGDGLQQDRAILCAARHWTAVIEGEGIGNYPGAADQPVSRHQPGDATERGRPTDRSTGIGAQRRRRQPGRQCRAGAAG